jgi:predicted site-specific integrase-resolvase
MTPEELMEYLSISRATLHRYRSKGLEPKYITPNTPRYHVQDVDEWVRKQVRK